ncbi:RDD family protein [Flavobacterium sp. PLA-1-15]|uniref:RDD family protein n=1 Tax=Flavobacterium sp. PLA-1-15 TaxID=3380533 RepID=UPI003B7823DE
MSYNKPFEVDSEIIASTGKRFANYIIDVLFIYAILIILLSGIAIVSALFGSYGFAQWLQTMSDLEFYLVYFLIVIIYFIFFETLTSRSLAKYITGTIVVFEDGSRPDFGTITKRTLCRFIPFDALSFFASDARGWHDSISDTYVVSKKGLETKMKLFTELDEIGVSQD